MKPLLSQDLNFWYHKDRCNEKDTWLLAFRQMMILNGLHPYFYSVKRHEY